MSAAEIQATIIATIAATMDYLCTALNSAFAISFIGAIAGAYAGAVAAQRSIEKSEDKKELLKEIRGVNAAIIVSLTICNTLLSLKSQIVLPTFVRFAKDRDAFRVALEQHRNGRLLDASLHCQMDFMTFIVPLLPMDALKDLVYQQISAHGKPLGLVSQIEGAAAGLRGAVDRRQQIAEEFKCSPPKSEELPFFYYGEQSPSGQTHREHADVLEAILSYTNDIIWFSCHLCDELVRYGRVREQQFAKRYGKGSPKINEPDFKKPRENGLIPPDNEYSSWLQWISERKVDIQSTGNA